MPRQTFHISGMHCVNCEAAVKQGVCSLSGIEDVEVSYRAQIARISFDEERVSTDDITEAIREAGYRVNSEKHKSHQAKMLSAGLVIVVGIYLLLELTGVSSLFNRFPTATQEVGYGFLFVIGVLTSIHCISMCGGINLSQSLSGKSSSRTLEAFKPNLAYNIGRLCSYTLLGGIIGAVGAVLAFGDGGRALIQLIAGIFIVVMGVNMLGIFPLLRNLGNLLPRKVSERLSSLTRGKGPFIVGLLNGFMPCGPLQAMQLFALSTGSFFQGALAMFLFCAGTLPVMIGFGAIGSLMKRSNLQKLMTVGAFVIVFMGISMFGNGLQGVGISLPSFQGQSFQASMEEGAQTLTTQLESGSYPAIEVRSGTPVRWIINAEESSINGCNNRFLIPEYSIEYSFHIGENLIEFTPTEPGTYTYSCWMNMIHGTITVTE